MSVQEKLAEKFSQDEMESRTRNLLEKIEGKFEATLNQINSPLVVCKVIAKSLGVTPKQLKSFSRSTLEREQKKLKDFLVVGVSETYEITRAEALELINSGYFKCK